MTTLARFRRWVYLLCYGMWRGECACSVHNMRGELVALTTITDEHQITNVWWERSRKDLLDARKPVQPEGHL